MNSTAQILDNNFKNSGLDKKENKLRGLCTIYNMNSTAQMSENNLNKSGPDKKENKVRGLSTIYNMNSNKQMAVKQTNTNLLDTVVPDMNVPIMETNKRKPSKRNRFNSRKWYQNAVKQTSLQIAHWILNTEIEKIKKLPLPAKIKDLVDLVRKSSYYKVPFQNNKLSGKKYCFQE